MEERKNVLCSRHKEYGTIDLWINPEGEGTEFNGKKQNIIVSYNGEPLTHMAYSCSLQDCENVEEVIDWLMGYIDRDTQNWYYKDLVIHWGVHTLKFINERNITEIEKDEYSRSLEDICYYNDVEW